MAVASAEQVRAFAHPLRIRILEALREGPATASSLGRALGESSGATSYHLRALARAGLIEEDEQPSRRERWWRRRSARIVFPTGSAEPDVRAAEARLRAFFIARDERALAEFLAHEHELDSGWNNASFVGAWEFALTADETETLGREVLELIDRYREPRSREGARRVTVSFRALPRVD
jgi:DNA-binding transcriptional ArsR family regulator